MKRIASVAIIAMLMAAMALTPSVSAAPVFKIGGLASLQSGYGQSMVSGAGLAIEEINAAGGVNGIKLEIDWQDTEANASIGRTATQKLVYGSKVDAMLGCHASTVILATEGLLERWPPADSNGSATASHRARQSVDRRVREPDQLTAQVWLTTLLTSKSATRSPYST